MNGLVDVRNVFAASGRAVALVADGCVGLRKAQWEAHLEEHDAACAALAELIEALRMSDEWIRKAVNFGGCKIKSGRTLYRNSQALSKAGCAI